MTVYIPSPTIAVIPPTTTLTMRVAAFTCEGLESLSRDLGFPVAVVAAVTDVESHARRLRDTWYAAGVPKTWEAWCSPFDFDNWLYRNWWKVPFDARWFGHTPPPLKTYIDDGDLLLNLPGGVDRTTFAMAFKDGLADLRFEALIRHPSFQVKWHHARRGGPPSSRYAYASAGDPTPIEVRDVVRLTPKDLRAIATVAVTTLERLARACCTAAPAVSDL